MILGYSPSREERIALLLSQPFLSEEHCRKELADIVGSGHSIDFEKVYSIALENGVAGFAYKNTRDLDLFPQKVNKNLQQIYRRTAFRNLEQLHSTLNLLSVLSDNGISAIPLKGAASSDLLFNDLGVYPSGDIDLLIHPSQLFQAKEVLCGVGGYRQVDSISEEDLLASHYHLLVQNNRFLVELHWNLVKRYFEVPGDFWWQETRATDWNGTITSELSIEKYLMYTIFRLFDHCFFPLRFFVLVGGIIDRHSNEIDWEKLMDYAGQYKMKRLVVFTLTLLNEILNTRVPATVMQTKIVGYGYLKSMVYSGLFSGIKKKHLRMMLYSVLLDEPGTIIRILIKRLFPSKGELRLRYNLAPKSSKVYLYYLLNPIFLMMHGNDQ